MNLKKFRSFMKHALLVAIVLTTAGITGCDDDDTPAGPTVFDGTVLDLIKSDQFKQSAGVPAEEALDSLVKYIEAYGLSSMLTGTSSDITLFAPSNQAFVNLLTTTPGFPEDITSISASTIQAVLSYHIVGSGEMQADLTSGTTLNTMFAQPDFCDPEAAGETQIITVNDDGTLLTGSTNSEIEITSADHQANNGVVHVVESVMIPPSVGARLTPILTTVAAPAFLSSDFSILAGLITYADCAHTTTTTSFDIAEILANPNGDYTVFMVPDAIFEANGYGDDVTEVITYLAGQGYTTPEAIRGLLLGHIVTPEYTATELGAETSVTAITGSEITVAMNNTTIILNGAIAVIGPDADVRDNGRMHVVSDLIGL